MIAHVVLLALRDDHDPVELQTVMDGLAALKLPGFDSFRHGPNIDAEGKSPGYPYGFVATFADRAALATYAADPGHKALGARLAALCTGGGAGIFVADLDV
ncbi:Dabb family protein [Pseudoroseicyclus sp. H15]